MKMRGLLASILLMFWALSALAKEAQSLATPTPSPAPPAKKSRTKETMKDAEGTQAPNRFEADPVIKSRYTLDGNPLEVDTD